MLVVGIEYLADAPLENLLWHSLHSTYLPLTFFSPSSKLKNCQTILSFFGAFPFSILCVFLPFSAILLLKSFTLYNFKVCPSLHLPLSNFKVCVLLFCLLLPHWFIFYSTANHNDCFSLLSAFFRNRDYAAHVRDFPREIAILEKLQTL